MTFEVLASRLNTKNAKFGARYTCILVVYDESGDSSTPSISFFQPIRKGEGKPLYQGKVVMLIDERAVSLAEHTGLFLESACDITFIGSHTTGSNGDVTTTVLPDGIIISFSGQGVRHVD